MEDLSRLACSPAFAVHGQIPSKKTRTIILLIAHLAIEWLDPKAGDSLGSAVVDYLKSSERPSVNSVAARSRDEAHEAGLTDGRFASGVGCPEIGARR